jgi:glutamyl-tRNA synthetase
VVNLLALLGWNSGTEQEVFDLEELIAQFSIERVQKSGAKFDPDKALWFQNHYFQNRSNQSIVEEFNEWLRNNQKPSASVDLNLVVGLVKERVSFVKDLWGATDFFFEPPTTYDPKGVKRAVKDNTVAVLSKLLPVLKAHAWSAAEDLSGSVKEWCLAQDIGVGSVMMPLRLFLVGAMKGPDVFDIMMVLGKEQCLERINSGIQACG